MKFITHPALVALGVATLCLLPLLSPLVSPEHRSVYHLYGSALSIFVPVLMTLGTVWLILVALLWFAERWRWFHPILWAGLIVLTPWMLLRNWFSVTNAPLPDWLHSPGLCSLPLIVVLVFCAWHPSLASWFQRLQGFAAVLLGFLSMSGILLLCQLALFTWQARALNAPSPLHQRQAASGGTAGHRVVWILFDELSHDQVYGRRFTGLQLPAFDQLAANSTVFTHAEAPAILTELAIPSLMTGLPVDKIRITADGRKLSLHNPTQDNWTVFDPRQTVFKDALDAGYSTAIAGWYNPYCRILPEALDRCFWTNHVGVPGGMFPGQAISWNAATFFIHHLQPFLSHLGGSYRRPTSLEYDSQFHQLDYRELVDAADSLLTDSSATFVFLHMPIPHPGGIYDRQTSNFTTGRSSYIDNLALADHYLAHVHDLLAQRGEWDSSMVVVMGDHSWRTKFMWSRSPFWTPEDQAASEGGQFDDRPAYIVKLPNQQYPAHIDAPFPAIRTRALLDQLLHHSLGTPDDLAAWAAAKP
jgi:hypothetical protein